MLITVAKARELLPPTSRFIAMQAMPSSAQIKPQGRLSSAPKMMPFLAEESSFAIREGWIAACMVRNATKQVKNQLNQVLVGMVNRLKKLGSNVELRVSKPPILPITSTRPTAMVPYIRMQPTLLT